MHFHLRRGLEPPNPVVGASLLATTFWSGVATTFRSSGGATTFLASSYAALDSPLPEPSNNIVVIVFSVAAFRSGWGAAASLASTYVAPDLPPLELPGSTIVVVFLATTFRSGGDVPAFLVSAYAPISPTLSKPCTCPAADLHGA
jgi:hypothetical protein